MSERESPLTSLTDHQRELVELVRRHQPGLTIETVTAASGQFNDVLIVNDEVVFRFPRTDEAAKVLAAEIDVLSAVRGRLPVDTPDPSLSRWADH